jgi:hypothetical protein
MAKGWKRGVSHNVGEKNPNRKLTVEDVKKIRELLAQREKASLPSAHPLSQEAIAAQFGVTPACISGIARGRIWKHV